MGSCVSYVKSDLFRYAGRVSAGAFLHYYLRHLGFRYSVWLRLTHASNPLVAVLAKARHRALSHKLGIQIPSALPIGYGLLIPHPMCIVVNSSARIGDNCTLGHCVTFGSASKAAARVGDGVFIGPHAVLVEEVTIGSGATIGAGSVVVKDVDAGDTVAGNPARRIGSSEGALIKNRWSVAR
ncbi:serine O-acetyltransferase [Sphingomonas jatrophae]|uniref:Serine O-acetyltransferase n=2 Tax=Sphingomonas jatrophae TaxID=1166337 RepID=A0A1I6K959_9SPHN|nr:serine O-acetyltransferase [Sphingomonas jatrophae]